MIAKNEEELIKIGEEIGKELLQKLVASPSVSTVVELVGDVGAGKTTLTKGLARGLNIPAEITSPSYTISKHYKNDRLELVHYDFYRLEDPGLMMEDLEESISSPSTVTVIEWGDSVDNILPKDHPKITISLDDSGSRNITIENLAIANNK